MDLEEAVRRAAAGDLEAFTEVTRRFQHMAWGYALSLVHDLQQAEDVVQEAFVAAWFDLHRLADPAAFPGWLRAIVKHQAHRVLRRRYLEGVPLDRAATLPAGEPGPDGRAEQRQQVGAVLARVARLPRPLREVVTLFYVHECSQQDIATFLGLPVTTVNNRLHAARAQLKRRTLTMVKDTLEAHQLPDDFATRIGRIVRAQAPVVEARFDPVSLPEVLSELTVSDEPRQRSVTVQVVQRLHDGVVRGVVLAPGEQLAPGMSVLSSGRRTESPVSREVLDRTVQVLAGRGDGWQPAVLETGIKVIDVTCPLVAGGSAAIAGEAAAGSMVLVEELARRLGGGPEPVSLFTLMPPGPWPSLHEQWQKDGYSDGTVGAVQTFWFLGEEEWTPERLAKLGGVDVVIRLSRELAGKRIYPAIDPLTSRSRALDDGLVGPEHAAIAARVRAALASLEPRAGAPAGPEAEAMRARARRLQRFFSQPFYVAEPYTRLPGVTVSMAEALRGCREILDGQHDDLPEEAFSFAGGIDDIRARATAPVVSAPGP